MTKFLEDIDYLEIIETLKKKNFDYKQEGQYHFFEKGNNYFEIRVMIFIEKGKVYEFEILSHADDKSQETIKNDLIFLFELVKPHINNKEMKKEIENTILNFSYTLKERNDSVIAKEYENFIIRTVDLLNEKSIMLEAKEC